MGHCWGLPGLLGKSELFTSDEMIQSDVLRTMLDLICSLKHKSQLAGLGVLAGLAMTSAEMAKKLLSPKLQQASGLNARLSTDSLCMITGPITSPLHCSCRKAIACFKQASRFSSYICVVPTES